MIIDVRLRNTFDNEDNLKALFSLTLDNSIAIHDIKLIQKRDGGLFVAFPNRKDKEGNYRDIVHPINEVSRKEIVDSIFEAYNNHKPQETL